MYYYIPLPTVAGVSPSMGPSAGGNTVTITGTGLTLTTAVHFGTHAATGITVVSDNQITVQAPSGTGTVAVTVSTPGGTSLPGVGNPYYTYVALPVINALIPAQGPATGGTAVTITGTNLGLTKSVLIGGIAVPFVVVSDSRSRRHQPGRRPRPRQRHRDHTRRRQQHRHLPAARRPERMSRNVCGACRVTMSPSSSRRTSCGFFLRG